MGVYIRGLDKSNKNGLSGYIDKIRHQTGKLCHQFEEHFAETMLFWVVVNPLRHAIIKNIKWLEAFGIPALFRKYYALCNERRVRGLHKNVEESETENTVFVGLKHLMPLKVLFLLAFCSELVMWLVLERICKHRKNI